jgi:hypothetical protein
MRPSRSERLVGSPRFACHQETAAFPNGRPATQAGTGTPVIWYSTANMLGLVGLRALRLPRIDRGPENHAVTSFARPLNFVDIHYLK